MALSKHDTKIHGSFHIFYDICIIMSDFRCCMAENNTAMLSNFLPINKKVKTNKILLIKKKKDAVSIHTHTQTHRYREQIDW